MNAEPQSASEVHQSRATPAFDAAAVSDDDLEAINRLAAAPLRADQVYVRSMYLCSTRPCDADGCQLTRAALEQIASKIVGQSVLPGHDRRSLPLARFYKAGVVTRDDAPGHEGVCFVRAWFYWLRDVSGARDLLLNIDGGVYRETSLAWKFNAWRCSICGAGNGACSHRPGQSYGERRCYRLIDSVTDVLEGSLVYKGADKDTNLTAARSAGEGAAIAILTHPQDELFGCLQRASALEPIDEEGIENGSFNEALDGLWLTGEADDALLARALSLLAEGGACIIDINDPGLRDMPIQAFIKHAESLQAAPFCMTEGAA